MSLRTITLTAISMLGWAAWCIFNKLALRSLHPIQIQIIGCLIGLTLLPLYIWYVSKNIVPLTFPFTGITLATIATLCATAASTAYFFNISTGNLGALSVVISSYPVLVFVFSALCLGEPVSLLKIFGVILVILGGIILSI